MRQNRNVYAYAFLGALLAVIIIAGYVGRMAIAQDKPSKVNPLETIPLAAIEAEPVEKMDNEKLGTLLETWFPEIEGEGGVWRVEVEKQLLLVMTDERANRMRIMTPVAKFNAETDKNLAKTLLKANFDRALDARYAINHGMIWSVFLHPLKSLTPSDLKNAVKQVLTLAENTGTTYTSSDLVFGGGEAADEAEPKNEPDNKPAENGKPDRNEDGYETI